MMLRKSLPLIATASLTIHIQAAVVLFDNVNVSIPDGDPGGVVNSQTVAGLPNVPLSDVNVRLTFDTDPGGGSPAFNGDLYVALSFGAEYAVLLTRPGRSTSLNHGYSDAGFGTVGGGAPYFTLDDQAANDVHTYQMQVGIPPGSVSGVWKPSARQALGTNPGEELDTTPRDPNATLSAFNGLNPNGTWTLFIIDAETGGRNRLQSWGLEFNVTPVPEPASWCLVVGLGLGGFAWARRRNSPGK